MPKEKSFNSVQAQHKSDKAKALKKSKATVQAQRNEKLARRNPERLQRQLDDLRALESSGQPLRPKDKQTLEQLEKDLKAVKRARETLGDKAPDFKPSNRNNDNLRNGRDGGDGRARGTDHSNNSHLGKRRRGERDASQETDEGVRSIPMPRDTPPPIPRRPNTRASNMSQGGGGENNAAADDKPLAPAQTTYSSAPVLRDLAKESRRFVPAAVAQKIALRKGTVQGRLLEPEELDRLEKAGYQDGKSNDKGDVTQSTIKKATPLGGKRLEQAALNDAEKAAQAGQEEDELEKLLAEVGENVEDRTGMHDVATRGLEDARQAAEEAEKEAEYMLMANSKTGKAGTGDAERELRGVEMEEVADEDL